MSSYGHLLKVLADPTRRAIFENLRAGPRTVGELAEELPVSRPAVSQHLKVLREADLVRARRQGRCGYYAIDPRGLEPLRQYMESFWGEVLTAFERAADAEDGRTR